MIGVILLVFKLWQIALEYAYSHPNAFEVILFMVFLSLVVLEFYPELRKPKILLIRFVKRATSR